MAAASLKWRIRFSTIPAAAQSSKTTKLAATRVPLFTESCLSNLLIGRWGLTTVSPNASRSNFPVQRRDGQTATFLGNETSPGTLKGRGNLKERGRDGVRVRSAGDGVEAFVNKPMTFLGEPYMSNPFEIELAVRDSELDAFGVVNNATFAVYVEHGRHELLRDMGLDIRAMMRTRDALALAEQTLKFFAPLQSGDHFIVSTRVSKVSAVRLIFEQAIFRLPQREKVLEASSVGCFLDKRYKPTRIPQEARVKLKQYCDSH